MAAIGLCSAVGQFWWTQAFRFAPAAVAAPFSYLAMIWALLLGYFVWGDMPTPLLLAGAVVVAASGLYILYREAVRRLPHAFVDHATCIVLKRPRVLRRTDFVFSRLG